MTKTVYAVSHGKIIGKKKDGKPEYDPDVWTLWKYQDSENEDVASVWTPIQDYVVINDELVKKV